MIIAELHEMRSISTAIETYSDLTQVLEELTQMGYLGNC